MEELRVSKAESGQKLLNFLERRIDGLPSEFHRWIRTGQVRINGKRAKPFDRVDEGDAVRVPPFASPRGGIPASSVSDAPLPPVLYEDDDLLVLHKPAGLAVQGGTGQTSSVAELLAAHYAGADFVPAPAHRLDKDTSGLLLAGKSYRALRALTDAFAGRAAPVAKEYLAWVHGVWPHAAPQELHDTLAKNDAARKVQRDAEGREARCIVAPLRHTERATLLLVRLLTGRTHQIRVQLSSRGFPIVGDPLYGPPPQTPLKLHAFRVTLPDGRAFACAPEWELEWEVGEEEIPR